METCMDSAIRCAGTLPDEPARYFRPATAYWNRALGTIPGKVREMLGRRQSWDAILFDLVSE